MGPHLILIRCVWPEVVQDHVQGLHGHRAALTLGDRCVGHDVVPSTRREEGGPLTASALLHYTRREHSLAL